MNISELKEMARENLRMLRDSMRNSLPMRGFLQEQCDAILSLPDDDGEELVRLAERVLAGCGTFGGESPKALARAVLSRYRKREEPKKVSGWVNLYQDGNISSVYDTRDYAFSFRSTRGYVATIFVSGIEGVSPDQTEEGK